MKRSILGAGVLAALLILGFFSGLLLERLHKPIAGEAREAAAAAMGGNWEAAEALEDKARTHWQKSRYFRHCLINHEPMEEIDALFAELEVWAAARESGSYAAACGRLARAIENLADAYALRWENVL